MNPTTVWPNMIYPNATPQNVTWTPAAAPATANTTAADSVAAAAATRKSERVVWPPDYPTTINPMPNPPA